ncbi:hypothetical protein HYR53_04215 [Candidatus Acetothermia bacterium]|nr:hypothetical protein [Candidatus Acetothermia bacterium]
MKRVASPLIGLISVSALLLLWGCNQNGPAPETSTGIIAYVCNDGDDEICVIKSDGTGQKQITTNPGMKPSTHYPISMN